MSSLFSLLSSPLSSPPLSLISCLFSPLSCLLSLHFSIFSLLLSPISSVWASRALLGVG